MVVEKHYFDAPKLVHLLRRHGAKQGMQSRPDQNDVKRPRASDAEFASGLEYGDKFVAEQQPYYDMWKILYDVEAETGVEK